jgi:hypothetical protein
VLLRFFSPTALLPGIPCCFDILGRARVPPVDVLDFADATAFPSIIQRVEEERQFTLQLSSRALSEMRKQGLDAAGALVTKPSRTELEELLLTCMSLVARAARAAQFHEKIVFTLAAAETLLLGNAPEPIRQSLGQRLAFSTGDCATGRRAVAALVKNSYRCRSAYLHHGRQIGDLQTTKELQTTVWTALHNVLVSLGKISTQNELLRLTEDMILSQMLGKPGTLICLGGIKARHDKMVGLVENRTSWHRTSLHRSVGLNDPCRTVHTVASFNRGIRAPGSVRPWFG